MDDRMTLAALRTRAGYSQGDAAAKIGISKSTLAKWEQDSRRMPYGRIENFVQLYQVPPETGIYLGDATALSEHIAAAYEQHIESVRKRVDVSEA